MCRCICENCTETKNLVKCEVCNRPVCKECSKKNNEKNNLRNGEYKDICDYCAEIYWLGF